MDAARIAPSGPLRVLSIENARRTIVHYPSGRVAYHQGDAAESIYYIERGRVELTVVSHGGRHGVIGISGAGEFFGEECLGSDGIRMATARTLAPCLLLEIAKPVVHRMLHEEPLFAEIFISWLLSRNIRLQEDLVDQLVDSGEKRLARALLRLAGISREAKAEGLVPAVSQETLGEMIGTSRQRVNFFMNRFRRLGLIEYDDHRGRGLLVRRSLFSLLPLDSPPTRS